MDRILLSDKDKEYGNALAKAISNLHSEFEITIAELDFERDDFIKNQIEWNQYTLILVGGYSDSELVKITGEKVDYNRIVVLTNERVENINKQSENESRTAWYLYRYVGFRDMLADLNCIIGHVSGKKNISQNYIETNIVGFYSISGGDGKSVISMATARDLARYHDKKVFYLSLEELPATELFIHNNASNRNISDYLYYLFDKKDEVLCSQLSGFISSDNFGVETICPSRGRNDLKYLSPEELIFFLKFIADSHRYDYLILDLNSDLSETTMMMMDQCIHIILIQSDSPISRFKNSKLINYLNHSSLGPYPDSTLYVLNKTRSRDEMEIREGDFAPFTDQKVVCVANDENSFCYTDSNLEINMNLAFGDGIKQIAEELLSQKR